MKTVKVNIYKLTEVLTENRAQHEWEYTQAARGYLERYLARLEELHSLVSQWLQAEDLSAVQSLPNLTTSPAQANGAAFELIPPACHCEEFDRALDLLKWTSSDSLELDEREFESYARNNWEWKDQFELLKKRYMHAEECSWCDHQRGPTPDGVAKAR